MHPFFRFAVLTASALAAATCVQAQAGNPWASTGTHRFQSREALAGAPMKAGEAIHVAVSLRLRNQAALDAMTNALMAGQSSDHLTRDEFQARFAPTNADVTAIVSHLRQAGFANIRVADNHMLVSADGTAGAVQAAFNTELRHYTVQDRDAYANTSDAQVPAALAGIVRAVHGLQNVSKVHSMLKPATAAASSPAVQGHSPLDFPVIYHADGLPAATNATIGIIADGDISQSLADLKDFAQANHLSPPDVKEVDVGPKGYDTTGELEWDLDSQTSLAAAGGAVKQMIFYVGTSLEDAPLTEAFNQAVSDHVAQVINVSLGECEDYAKESGIEAASDAIFQVALAQGQTFSVSSGDSGSYECGSAKGGESYPAVSPYVMAIGGTQVSTTDQTHWAAETTWGCDSDASCLMFGGSGGGVSDSESAPSWQIASGVLKGSKQRAIPDIALDGDPASGALILNQGLTAQVGGTSLSAPLFAGFWARLESMNDNRLQVPASALYKYGVDKKSAKTLFHDITKGTIGGYDAATGWDDASGFGSLDVGKLATFIGSHTGF